ncbi:MAG: amidohydrolase family protein [Acidobacteria bacterium]|nr:amidohydrolase family protein [Acidobacteriota bacterium]
MKLRILLSTAFLSFAIFSWGQSINPKLVSYPDYILYNGKIVTVDDASFQSNVGTIVQALAIRDRRILDRGTNAGMQALAGPNTKKIDLKGRTVLPSFILTHEHPTDWAFQEPKAMQHVLPNDDVIVHRWLKSAPLDQQFAEFKTVLKEALGKARPGQWILIAFTWGPNMEWSAALDRDFGKLVTKADLDSVAPNNPVIVKNGLVRSMVNTRAIEAIKEVHPGLAVIGSPEYVKKWEQNPDGIVNRPFESNVMLRGKMPILEQILKAEMETWTANGVTGFGSSTYTFSNLQALGNLDRRGEMPARFAWGYRGSDYNLEWLRYLQGMENRGTDYLWLIGAQPLLTGGYCTTLAEKLGKPDLGPCVFAPGMEGRKMLDNIIAAGMRIATMHSWGDKDIDYLMDAIEEGSAKIGLTPDQIRAKRHAFDHGGGAPRPDQIPRMKKLGMMASQINTALWEDESHPGTLVYAQRFGLEYANWVVPRKSLTDAGIMSTQEIDRPFPEKMFYTIEVGMTREHPRTKQVYGAAERTDRIIQLKSLTTWAGHYVLREKELGSLEAGKFADLIVLDRDYMTIPVADMRNVKVLMTMVGGQVVHLTKDLGKEFGLPAVGATTW